MAKRGSELSAEEGERVRKGLEQLLARPEFKMTTGRPNYAAVGRELGLTGQAVSQMLDGKNNPSLDTAKAVAEKLGIHWSVLLMGAPVTARVVVFDERYPNFSDAVVAARAIGISEEAIAQVHKVVMSRKDDASPREWLRKLEAADDDVRREGLALQQDTDQRAKTRAANKARAEEMEQLTKPKLPKRRAR